MSKHLSRGAALSAVLLLSVPAAVWAMGSGSGGSGGGEMPSVQAPTYDPAEEYQRGVAALQAAKYKDAARAFQHVVDEVPSNANAWYMLGQAKSGAGDAKGAARAYQRAVKADPGPIAPHRALGLALVKLKDTAKANAELAALQARATTCNNACPESAELNAAIAAITAALAAPAPSAMAAPPGALIFATSQAGDTAYVRAVSLINEGRYTDALASLDAAEQVFGPHPDILTYKGYAWRKLGQLDRAEPYYQAALAIAPGHRGATEYYGELKVVRGDVAGARVMLARLDAQCAFGCAEAEELRRWIDHGGDPAS